MPLTLWETKAFARSKKTALKRYPKSKDSVDKALQELCNEPDRGAVYPGIDPTVRKVRLELKEYNIGTSSGLRLIYMYGPNFLLPVYLYKKGSPAKEQEVKKTAKSYLRNVISEISPQQ